MTIGTKSVLFGAHQFLLHPLLVAIGWWIEYGFRAVPYRPRRCGRVIRVRLLDPRLWLAFLVHDLGYWGKPNMDGPEGERHPEWGARVMWLWCGDGWDDLCLCHSRYYAKLLGRDVSPLCYADKRALVIEPSWLYLPRVWLSGELTEYLAVARTRAALEHEGSMVVAHSARAWHRSVRAYMRRWIAANKGRKDTWTPVRHGEEVARG